MCSLKKLEQRSLNFRDRGFDNRVTSDQDNLPTRGNRREARTNSFANQSFSPVALYRVPH